MQALAHVPVMVEETLQLLRPAAGWYVDATVGAGGHARALLAAAPDARLIGIDRDPEALARARQTLAPFGPRVRLVHGDFRRIRALVAEAGVEAVAGCLFDLGVSSMQLERAERGFHYRTDAPLDMRMDPGQDLTAADIVNRWPEREIARILRDYGEERWASRIARFIVEARRRRPLATAGDLVEVIKAAIPAAARRRGGHPARRTFQALRIAVNDELGALSAALPEAVDLLRPGGRVVVISFHSLEDRIVKHAFRAESARGRVEVLTPKPLRPRPDEVAANPRARSARLRAAERRGPAVLHAEGSA